MHDGCLEVMTSCLYAADKHSIVCGQEIENRKSLIETAKKYLKSDDYTVTIYASADCLLIKRPVINTFGFLDTSYSSLRYAILDYYCRLNAYGFSAVIANQALFSYLSGDAHTNGKNTAESNADRELFLSRYDYREEKESRFSLQDFNPIISFLKLIDNEYYPKKRILFDCSIMPPFHCGTSEFQISVFEAFYRLYKDKYDIYLYTNREADEYHKLSCKYKNVVYPDTLTGVYHLGFASYQLTKYENISLLSKHCLKIIQVVFDVIAVRIDEHLHVVANNSAELGFRLSDGIVFISEYSKNDFLSCYGLQDYSDSINLKVIYPATGIKTQAENECKLPFDEYFLVIGNSNKHKALKETVDVISKVKENFIFIGYDEDKSVTSNIHCYKSGDLKEDFITYLYSRCKAVIFPSMYEGFGLPVVIGLKNKKQIILNDNKLTRELYDHFHQFSDSFLFFDRFEKINEIITGTDFSAQPASQAEYNDSWDRVAAELEVLLGDITKVEANPEKLNQRADLCKLIEARKWEEVDKAEEELSRLRQETKLQKAELNNLHNQFGDYKLRKLLLFAMKENLRNRHKKLHSFFKKIFRK